MDEDYSGIAIIMAHARHGLACIMLMGKTTCKGTLLLLGNLMDDLVSVRMGAIKTWGREGKEREPFGKPISCD